MNWEVLMLRVPAQNTLLFRKFINLNSRSGVNLDNRQKQKALHLLLNILVNAEIKSDFAVLQ